MEKDTKAIDTLTKFCACFGIEKSFLLNRMKDEAFFSSKLGEKYEAWKKFMYKNDLEEYLNMLISLVYYEHIPKEVRELQEKHSEFLQEQVELYKTVVFMNTEEPLEITIQNKNESLRVSNKRVISLLIEGLGTMIGAYQPTFDELEKSYESIEEMLTEDQKKEIWDYINKFLVYPPEECENDPYFTETRKGAKKKNEIAFIIGKQLSFLVRLERFLTNNEGITDIEGIPLKNKDCMFIHDCLVAFREIESQTNREFTTTTPEKYIRTLLKQTVPYKVNIPTDAINQLKAELN